MQTQSTLASLWLCEVCVCVLWVCMHVLRSPPLLQHPAINLLWHVKLNLWANLLATGMFDLKRERRMKFKKCNSESELLLWHLEQNVSVKIYHYCKNISFKNVYSLTLPGCIKMLTCESKIGSFCFHSRKLFTTICKSSRIHVYPSLPYFTAKSLHPCCHGTPGPKARPISKYTTGDIHASCRETLQKPGLSQRCLTFLNSQCIVLLFKRI